MKKVYLLTEERYVDLDSRDPYQANIQLEDALLMKALSSLHIQAERVAWSDAEVNWSAADAVVFRTPWDYFERYPEFKSWFDSTRTEVRFINPPDQLLWNMDKHYLQELETKGIGIVPSIFIELGETRSLHEICENSPWQEFILKPCISGGAWHTYRFKLEDVAEHESTFKELTQTEALMLQEFHPSILERGEVSHMVFGGKYTHSILKRGKGSDFRVQDDFGGTVHPYEASADEIAFAERVFELCEPTPVYGRVDVMWNAAGEPMVGELEVVEPELWLRNHPSSAQDFAAAIYDSLAQ